MRILVLFLLAGVLSGCGMSAYNPHFIISDAPQATIEAKSGETPQSPDR